MLTEQLQTHVDEQLVSQLSELDIQQINSELTQMELEQLQQQEAQMVLELADGDFREEAPDFVDFEELRVQAA